MITAPAPVATDPKLAARMAYMRVKYQKETAGYTKPALRGASQQLWDSKDHEVMLAGPAETGKTWAALHKLHHLMLTNAGAQGAIVRKSYSTMHGTVLQTYRRILGKDSKVHAFGGEKPEWFDYPNGSRVFVGGMDNPQKVLSSERDIIYVNQAEELALDDWETLTTRATGRGAVMPYTQIYGDCNPGRATHWILNRPSLRVLYSHHEDNPTLYDEAGNQTEQGRRTMAVLDALTGLRHKRLRLGLWVGAEGMVYEQWDRSFHVLDAATLRRLNLFTDDNELNRDAIKSVYATVDWGWTNPGVIHVYGIDGDGRAYLVHEVYQTGRLISWWVEQGVSLKARYGISRFFCDPAEPAFIRQFNDAGLNAQSAVNDIPPGIQAMQKRLVKQPDGRARFYVYAGALEERDPSLAEQHKPCGLVEEIDAYVWQQPKDGKSNKEEPLDKDNHALDTARYLCATLDVNIQPRTYSIKGRR